MCVCGRCTKNGRQKECKKSLLEGREARDAKDWEKRGTVAKITRDGNWGKINKRERERKKAGRKKRYMKTEKLTELEQNENESHRRKMTL